MKRDHSREEVLMLTERLKIIIMNGRPYLPLPNFKESKIRERNFIRNVKDVSHTNFRFLSFADKDRVVLPNFLSFFNVFLLLLLPWMMVLV
jgi:hypothetical protein